MSESEKLERVLNILRREKERRLGVSKAGIMFSINPLYDEIAEAIGFDITVEQPVKS